MSITRIGTTKRWSDAVVFNNTVYMVEVPTNLTANLTEQTIELLQLIEDGLIRYGSDKRNILSVTIYLKDINQIEEFNNVWDSWLISGTAPSRACIEAKLAHPEFKVEIQLVAAIIS
jgi:enamine deaminase RidA (YjgF/YER057c/UK114 family)